MLVAPNRSINTCEQSLATTNENCVAQFSSPTSNTLRKPARDTGCAARAPDTMQTSRNDGSPDPKALLTSMEHYAVGLALRMYRQAEPWLTTSAMFRVLNVV